MQLYNTTVGGSNPVPTDGIPTLAYDQTSNRTNTSGWQYDNAGNLVRGQNQSGVWQRFEYDAANRLVKVKNDSGNPVETYVYGADRKRLMTGDATTGGIVYMWGGNSVIAEFYTNSGAVYWDKSYFYAGSRLVAASWYFPYPDDKLEYYHPDRLGSKLVTDPYANTSYEQSTLPFGTALNAESTGYSNRPFTSYDRSGSTGLDYAVNRTYSSGQGRFTQVDPAGEGSNLYAYVGNDPVNYTDNFGLLMSWNDQTCYIDGVQASCSMAYGLVQSGAGVFGPLDTTRWDPDANLGKGGWEFFRAYADGARWTDMQGSSVYITATLSSGIESWYAGSAFYSNVPGFSSFDYYKPEPYNNPVDPPGTRDPGTTREPPKQPSTPKDPCGGTTDINVGAFIFTVGVRLGDRSAIPYGGLTYGFPAVGGSMSYSDATPSNNVELSAQGAFLPGLGVTRTATLAPGRSFGRSLGNAVADLANLYNGDVTHTFGAMSPQWNVSLTAPITRISYSNDTVLCH